MERHGMMRGVAVMPTLLLCVACAVGSMTVGTAGCKGQDTATDDATTQQVTLAGRSFTLELALNDEQRFRGLSGRTEIAEDGGMLFVFPDERVVEQGFVMRDCPVPIDIIFLDPGGRITAMHAMEVEPPDTPEHQLHRYRSGAPAQFAIELAGGTLEQLELERGQRIELPLDSLKARAE